MKSPTQAQIVRLVSHILYILGLLAVLTIMTIKAHAQVTQIALASKTISLEDRYPVASVSDVFKDNMLLTLAYMAGKQDKNKPVDWNTVEKPFTYDFTLQPGQRFAFHDAINPNYAQNVVKTTNAHYTSNEGFKSDGYLIGDGVCHLASIFYEAAQKADIESVAPTNHDFANIPEIDKKYGVAIYADPTSPAASQAQNLYIRNNKKEPITFHIIYDGKDLTVEVLKQA